MNFSIDFSAITKLSVQKLLVVTAHHQEITRLSVCRTLGPLLILDLSAVP